MEAVRSDSLKQQIDALHAAASSASKFKEECQTLAKEAEVTVNELLEQERRTGVNDEHLELAAQAVSRAIRKVDQYGKSFMTPKVKVMRTFQDIRLSFKNILSSLSVGSKHAFKPKSVRKTKERATCLGFVPGASSDFSMYFWVGLPRKLEVYSSSVEEGPVQDFNLSSNNTVTTICTDLSISNDLVWTGHSNGEVWLHTSKSFFLDSFKQFSSPIAALCPAAEGKVWVCTLTADVALLEAAISSVEDTEQVQGTLKAAVQTFACEVREAGSAKQVTVTSFLAVEGYLCMASEDGYLRLYTAVGGALSEVHKYKCKLDGKDAPCTSLAVMPWKRKQHAHFGDHWRLLTGHTNGQVLVWEASSDKLKLLFALTAPGSSVRNITILDQYGLLVVGTESGSLVFIVLPVPSSVTIGNSPVPDQPLVLKQPQQGFKAHNTNLVTLVHYEGAIATCSKSGGVRIWDVDELLLLATAKNPAFSQMRRPRSDDVPEVSCRDRTSANSEILLQSLSGISRAPTQQSAISVFDLGIDSPMSSPQPRLPSQPALLQSPHPVSPQRTTPTPTPLQRPESMSKQALPDTQMAKTEAMLDKQNEIIINRADIQFVEVVGSGAEGKVWRSKWLGQDVAVKEVHSASSNKLSLLSSSCAKENSPAGDFMKEVEMLSKLTQHPNIVRFFGVAIDMTPSNVKKPPGIVMEYYPLGSLFTLLEQAREGEPSAVLALAWPKPIHMLLSLASGMAYLHGKNCVHGDLRSPNLFVDKNKEVKVGDFGFAKLLGDGNEVASSRLTNPRWMAPEALEHAVMSKEADVYSYGIIMWELLTWDVPFQDLQTYQVMMAVCLNDIRPELPDESQPDRHYAGQDLTRYKQLMQLCWSRDAKQRPRFTEIIEKLNAMRNWKGVKNAWQQLRVIKDWKKVVQVQQEDTRNGQAQARVVTNWLDNVNTGEESVAAAGWVDTVTSAGPQETSETEQRVSWSQALMHSQQVDDQAADEWSSMVRNGEAAPSSAAGNQEAVLWSSSFNQGIAPVDSLAAALNLQSQDDYGLGFQPPTGPSELYPDVRNDPVMLSTVNRLSAYQQSVETSFLSSRNNTEDAEELSVVKDELSFSATPRVEQPTVVHKPEPAPAGEPSSMYPEVMVPSGLDFAPTPPVVHNGGDTFYPQPLSADDSFLFFGAQPAGGPAAPSLTAYPDVATSMQQVNNTVTAHATSSTPGTEAVDRASSSATKPSASAAMPGIDTHAISKPPSPWANVSIIDALNNETLGLDE